VRQDARDSLAMILGSVGAPSVFRVGRAVSPQAAAFSVLIASSEAY
jgi:hypothetical protein